MDLAIAPILLIAIGKMCNRSTITARAFLPARIVFTTHLGILTPFQIIPHLKDCTGP